MSEKASEAQIAEIIERLIKSPIPASFQDGLLSSLHTLTDAQAASLLIDLSKLADCEDAYTRATQNWHDAWRGISERVLKKLSAEARKIESDCFARLRGQR